MTHISSREVELDGEVTIEIAADGRVVLDLLWNAALPLTARHPGWTLVPRPGTLAAGPEQWPWDADDQRDLAQLADALHDYHHRRAARSEMRVRYWEFRAREGSAEAAAAWGRAWLARRLALDRGLVTRARRPTSPAMSGHHLEIVPQSPRGWIVRYEGDPVRLSEHATLSDALAEARNWARQFGERIIHVHERDGEHRTETVDPDFRAPTPADVKGPAAG